MRRAFKIPDGYLMVHEETLRQLLPEAAMSMLLGEAAPRAPESPADKPAHKEIPRQLRNVGDVPLVDRRVPTKSDECMRRVEAVRAIGLPTNYDPNVGMVMIRTPDIRVNYFATTSNWFDVRGRLDMGVGHGLDNFLAKLAEKIVGAAA